MKTKINGMALIHLAVSKKMAFTEDGRTDGWMDDERPCDHGSNM